MSSASQDQTDVRGPLPPTSYPRRILPSPKPKSHSLSTVACSFSEVPPELQVVDLGPANTQAKVSRGSGTRYGDTSTSSYVAATVASKIAVSAPPHCSAPSCVPRNAQRLKTSLCEVFRKDLHGNKVKRDRKDGSLICEPGLLRRDMSLQDEDIRKKPVTR